MHTTNETQLETPLAHYKLKKIECDEPIRSLFKHSNEPSNIDQLIEEAQNLNTEISIATLDSSIESSKIEPQTRVQIPSQKKITNNYPEDEDTESNKA